MHISLRPIDDTNREAVLALSVREDQPFVAPNDYSLKQAEEINAEHPGVARPFAIYADDALVGFCMFSFAPEEEVDLEAIESVLDLLPEALRRRNPGPVGRLDRDVTGLVLLTTDGQLAHRLISPRWTVAKVYLAETEGALTEADAERLRAGVAFKDFVIGAQ